MSVISCIVTEHNFWLVLLASVVCIIGALATTRLLERARRTEGVQRLGWILQTASVAGSSVWCTHFVAILAYDPETPVSFDPMLTVASLAIPIFGFGIGFAVAATNTRSLTALFAGLIVGLTIALMHYVGMAAYHISGIVTWDANYIAASVVLSVVIAMFALYLTTQTELPYAQYAAAMVLVLAIVSLHFTGMTAVSVVPLASNTTNEAALQAMAIAVAGVSLFIVATGIASHMIDARSRSESHSRLEHMSLTDSLTGLPNRKSAALQVESQIVRAQKGDQRFALVVLDLNQFKEINELRGHRAGDQVLKIVAGRLAQCMENGEFVARLGGDEFAAVKRIGTAKDLLTFLARLEATLSMPVEIDDFRSQSGASFGVAVYPDDGTTLEGLFGNADLAMNRSKADPTKAVCFYEKELDDAVRERKLLARELRSAVELNQLELHFQVQTTIQGAEVCGYEVLLRWRHPRHGMVPPLAFIGLAEETGSIVEIGAWVLREACRRAAAWQTPYRIAVNMSPIQLAQPDLPRIIHQILIETKLPPSRLELEITESAIINDKVSALHMLRQIRALGVTISLDDFGTGYSSFETLRSFPFDKIKLDRSFMTEVESSPQSLAIVRAVLTLGRSLGVTILAEGVETESQLDILRSEGCDEAQGYLLGRPKPHDDLFESDGASIATAAKPVIAAVERIVA